LDSLYIIIDQLFSICVCFFTFDPLFRFIILYIYTVTARARYLYTFVLEPARLNTVELVRAGTYSVADQRTRMDWQFILAISKVQNFSTGEEPVCDNLGIFNVYTFGFDWRLLLVLQ